ncbi:hypothetical protein LHYA1_G007840 [Lachnellula hyalina]|uniref:Uncharacterized protein n=1 Tax=Lachnellula hyalina TaxID=1316788 RepID=A0A8H8QW98_9HELO|nr:uncharacterized protein LHYA1_G007840 [Lachnellula hyalina]TVY23701.1 hypothetical protein LHYA1_G007840 [Lachnellula hyalina]
MPPSKPKPSEIAAEAKRTYIPYIRQNFSEIWPSTSFLCYSESMCAQPSGHLDRQARFAFYDDDPVDLALKWNAGEKKAIAPIIMPANDKRPGGDWEAGKLL